MGIGPKKRTLRIRCGCRAVIVSPTTGTDDAPSVRTALGELMTWLSSANMEAPVVLLLVTVLTMSL